MLQSSSMDPWRLGSPPGRLFSFVCFMSFTGKNGSMYSLVLGKKKWYLLLDSPKNPRLRKGQEPLSWTINRNRSDVKYHLPQSSNSKLILPRVGRNPSRNTMGPVPSPSISWESQISCNFFFFFFANFGLNSCTLQNLFQIPVVDIYHKAELLSPFSSLKSLKTVSCSPLGLIPTSCP